MRIIVIAKPAVEGGGPEGLEAVLAELRTRGHEVHSRLTNGRGAGELFARAAAHAGADLVLAVGGDGTINEVVNGLAPFERPPRLGIIPAGTANDFAHALELPMSVAEAAAVAVSGRATPMDVAQVNDRYFINVSTGGFGADATRTARSPLKRLLGPFAYVLSGARRLARFAPACAAFEVDGTALYEGPFAFFAVGNSWRTGGGTRVTPRAERGDGALDVVIVGNVSRFDLLTLLPDLRAGTHLESPDVLYLRARRLEVRGSEVLRVNADGEPVSAARLRYGVLERRLEVMTP